MPSFKITLQRNTPIFTATVSARRACMIGDIFNGEIWKPDEKEILKRLPYRYRPAFRRAIPRFYYDNFTHSCDLFTQSGKPIGTLYATIQFDER